MARGTHVQVIFNCGKVNITEVTILTILKCKFSGVSLEIVRVSEKDLCLPCAAYTMQILLQLRAGCSEPAISSASLLRSLCPPCRCLLGTEGRGPETSCLLRRVCREKLARSSRACRLPRVTTALALAGPPAPARCPSPHPRPGSFQMALGRVP